jgi:2-oxo-4-hydroxy-4-carboxy-5-ureidoimidazoline decarboxylase
MTTALNQLNTISASHAETEFLKCCGSQKWAQQMAQRRPFADISDLLTNAHSIWWSLDGADWFEAFSHHPKIGEKQAAAAQSSYARAWAEQEQSQARAAAPETVQILAQANRDYERQFGYIFIVCATGKSSAEILALLQERLKNSPESELPIAAAEQAKITELRLLKLLNQ